MKIVGFAQLNEELRRGFLPWWMQSMERVCDVIYIWDQNSQDGSRDFYKQHPKCHVHEHHCNDLFNEIDCKRKLLSKLKVEQPDTDWVFWMDGDTVLEEKAHDGIRVWLACQKEDNAHLPHYNLWRGNTHHRVDSGFASLLGGVPAFWRMTPSCVLQAGRGLHKSQFPVGRSCVRCPYALLHLGFSTDQALYERMVIGDLPRRDPNVNNHRRHYLKPKLTPLPPGMLPPYIPVRASETDPLPHMEMKK